MKKLFIVSISLITLGNLNGQVEQQSLPGAEEISNRRTSFNLDEIKVRWKKAALENCTGAPCAGGGSFTCGTSTVVDIDGNTYNTVLIGTQCWTKSNLKVTKYNDGTAITFDNSGGSAGNGAGETWSARATSLTAAYSILSNEPSNGTNATNYGFLYNWFAVTDPKKICPAGWHVPSDAEFTALGSYASPDPGDKLKSTSSLWVGTTTKTDNFGFSALPGRLRQFNGEYKLGALDRYAYFWTTTQDNSTIGFPDAWQYAIYYNSNTLDRYSSGKEEGASIRCLKD